MYSFKLTMSAVICQTVQSTLSVPAHVKMHGALHWPSGSKGRSSKPPAIRIVASEPSPSPPHHDDYMAAPPAMNPHPHTSSSRVGSTDAPNVKRHEQHIAGEKVEVPFPERAPSHTRTQSTSVISESKSTVDLDARRHRRTRAASSSGTERNSRPRPRLPSMLATVLTQNKAPAQPRESTNDPELLGSFTPTSSPRPRLRSLLTGTSAPPEFSGALSSSSSSPSQLPTPPPRRPSALRVGHGYGTEPRRRHRSDAPRAGITRHWRSASDAAPVESSDPPGSPNLPSICRTPSSYSSSDYFPTAPSSAGPTTPVHTGVALPVKRDRRKSEATSLHPVLENLERTSLFRVVTACATCGMRGSNFPCCPKCGEMWCSRACRLQKGNGKKHICSKATA